MFKFTFNKQKDRWNQILRERKYRPSFFGMTVHFDWHILLLFLFVGLFLVAIYTFNLNQKFSVLLKKDFSSEVQFDRSKKIDIDRFDQVLKQIEKK